MTAERLEGGQFDLADLRGRTVLVTVWGSWCPWSRQELPHLERLRQQMAKANRDSTRLRLRQIEAALARLEDEDYGRCRSCDEPIAIARLRIRPEAVLCVECQQDRERR